MRTLAGKAGTVLSLVVASVAWTQAHEGGGSGTAPSKPASVEKIRLSSRAFKEGEEIPTKYSQLFGDISPPLEWGPVPKGAKSLALIVEDVWSIKSAGVEKAIDHWVLFNLPPDTRRLPEGIPAKETLENGARHGKNVMGQPGYMGWIRPQRCRFRLYALDGMLDLAAGAGKEEVLKAMQGHVLAEGELNGKFTGSRGGVDGMKAPDLRRFQKGK